MTAPLLVLRPEPEASATAADAVALGLTVIKAPLFAGVPVAWTAPAGDFDAVLMTSANAARLGGARVADYAALPLYAVGPATAEAARGAGFAVAYMGSAGVDDVLRRIAIDRRGRILHLAGRDTSAHPDPPFDLLTVVVYAFDPLPPPDLPIRAVALVHSARAGERLASIVSTRSAIDIVAIGPRSAAAAGSGWRSVRWPDAPRDAAMLALAAPLCES